MAWVKSHDRKPWTRKMLALSDPAYRLYDHALHHSASVETDGEILLTDIPAVVAGVKFKKIAALIAELVRLRLWHEAGMTCDSDKCPAYVEPVIEGAWVIHDYFDQNRTKEELAADREFKRQIRAEAGRAGGIASGEVRRSKTEAKPKQNGEANAQQDSSSAAKPRPVPSRPVRSSKQSSEGVTPEAARLMGAFTESLGRRVRNPKTPTAAWWTAARLLLTQDRAPLDEALGMVEWVEANTFWRGVILSMPTFREKYEQLRLQRDRDGGSVVPIPSQSERLTRWAAELEAQGQ